MWWHVVTLNFGHRRNFSILSGLVCIVHWLVMAWFLSSYTGLEMILTLLTFLSPSFFCLDIFAKLFPFFTFFLFFSVSPSQKEVFKNRSRLDEASAGNNRVMSPPRYNSGYVWPRELEIMAHSQWQSIKIWVPPRRSLDDHIHTIICGAPNFIHNNHKKGTVEIPRKYVGFYVKFKVWSNGFVSLSLRLSNLESRLSNGQIYPLDSRYSERGHPVTYLAILREPLLPY